MFLVRNQNLSATMELNFQTPVAFDEISLKSIANAALEAFEEFQLRPNQIWQRTGDALFDYELAFTLFNGQASFRFGAERASGNIRNARGRRDVEVVVQCLASAAECFQVTQISRTFVQTSSHACFEPSSECEAYFSAFADAAQSIIDGGRIALVQEKAWTAPVRVSIERSIAFENAAFITWSTESPGKIDLEGMREIPDLFEKTSRKIGLKVELE